MLVAENMVVKGEFPYEENDSVIDVHRTVVECSDKTQHG